MDRPSRRPTWSTGSASLGLLAGGATEKSSTREVRSMEYLEEDPGEDISEEQANWEQRRAENGLETQFKSLAKDERGRSMVFMSQRRTKNELKRSSKNPFETRKDTKSFQSRKHREKNWLACSQQWRWTSRLDRNTGWPTGL